MNASPSSPDAVPAPPEPAGGDPVLENLLRLPPASLPNAFLVGAMKSGTSWLAKQIERHPGAFVPGIKEPNLLVSPEGRGFPIRGPLPEADLHHRMHRFSTGTVQEYAALYTAAPDTARVRLDASIRYLVSDLAADRIATLYQTHGLRPRILVILRDPVERTWSHWQMHRAMGIEPLGLGPALDAEAGRMREGWSDDWAYDGYSRYDGQLRRYFDRFGHENVHVEIQERAVADPAAAMDRVFRFLGLDPDESKPGDPARRVREKKRTGSSGIEQVAQYWRPGWRKVIPASARRAAWRLLETLNTRAGDRKMPQRERERLTERLAPSARATAALLDARLPWPTCR